MIRGRELQTAKALGLGAILASYIFLFAPFTLYVGNLDEFTTSFPTILSFYLRPAAFVIAVCGLVGIVLRPSVFRGYLVLLAAINIVLWLQGNILVWDYGLLDGRGIDWERSNWRGWLDLGIWVAVVLTAVFFHRRTGKPDRKSTRLNSSHMSESRMPSSA